MLNAVTIGAETKILRIIMPMELLEIVLSMETHEEIETNYDQVDNSRTLPLSHLTDY